MHLDGDLAGAELGGDLLVQHARHHQAHDLALARRQQVVPFAQAREILFAFPRDAVEIQGLLDSVQQVLLPEGLRQELHRSRFHRLHAHGNVAMTGEEDDGNMNARLGQVLLYVEPADARKPHVQNQAARTVRAPVLEELLRARKGFRLQPHRFQQSLDRLADPGVVVDDEHGGNVGEGHGRASTSTGSVK